jgi:hypothetical protein
MTSPLEDESGRVIEAFQSPAITQRFCVAERLPGMEEIQHRIGASGRRDITAPVPLAVSLLSHATQSIS